MELSRERRWQAAVAAAGLAVLVAGVLLVGVDGDERRDGEISAARDGTSPSTTLPPTSGPTTVTTSIPPATSTSTTITPTPTTVAPTTVTSQPPTTTPTVACRDSTNPACGPLVWDPLPAANAPMTISIAYEPQPARVGQTVVFRLVVDDPDAPISSCITIERYGDDSPAPTCVPSPCPPQYGPWTPVPRPGHLERTFQHTYTRPGTYVASFGFTSQSCGASMIFGNAGSIEANVVVGP